jgi:methionyl-tRNA formyltransferase
MVETLDAGEVYLRRSMTILPDDTTGSLEARLAEVGATLLIDTLDAIEEKTMALLPQTEADATFAPIIRKEDGRIDWSRPAEEIERRVRAFDPWPVAFTTIRGKTLRVWKARVEEPIKGAPPADADGTILAVRGDGLRVSCAGGGLLTLLEVQPEGRRRMSATEAAAGRHLGAGDRLGS